MAPHRSVSFHTESDSHTHGLPPEGRFGGHVPRAPSGRGLRDWSPAKSWAGVLGRLLQEFLLCVEGTEPWAPRLDFCTPICSRPLQAGAREATAAVAPVRVKTRGCPEPPESGHPGLGGGPVTLEGPHTSIPTPGRFQHPPTPAPQFL